MNYKLLSGGLLSTLLLLSCGGDAAKENQETKSAEQKEEVIYSYTLLNDSNKVYWTAYKFNEKVGVTGQLMEIHTNYEGDEMPSVAAIIEDMEFHIPTSSVNSNDGDRDPKIREQFFGTLNTESIMGRFTEVSGDDNSGKGQVFLTMNNIEKSAPFTYEVNQAGEITVRTEINIEDWDGAEAIAALNKVCSELHKGADGESKLWSVVNIVVKSYISKEESTQERVSVSF
jgi:hypothetical protein